MLFILLFILSKQGIASCMELTEVSSKKNSIFTFTNKINSYFPEKYEYCIKISNKSAAIFMNNAIAKVSISTGSKSSKKFVKLSNRKALGYYFLPSEQENIINFKIKKNNLPFSVSFISFPDECDIKVVSNDPEKVISSKDYITDQIKKSYNHVCYFSGFPFETQLSYEESIEKKYSFKITSRSKVSTEQIVENGIEDDHSQKSIRKIANITSPALLEWNIPKGESDFFLIHLNENKCNLTKNSRIDRNFKHQTKIHQILNSGNRTIIGHISNGLDKGLLVAIIAIMAVTFVFVLIIAIFILHRKGVCCVKTITELDHDSDDWEISVDQDENKIVFRKPYLVGDFENPYGNDKTVSNIIKKESSPVILRPILNYQVITAADSITEHLIPGSD